jgi:hypothetical protein
MSEFAEAKMAAVPAAGFEVIAAVLRYVTSNLLGDGPAFRRNVSLPSAVSKNKINRKLVEAIDKLRPYTLKMEVVCVSDPLSLTLRSFDSLPLLDPQFGVTVVPSAVSQRGRCPRLGEDSDCGGDHSEWPRVACQTDVT